MTLVATVVLAIALVLGAMADKHQAPDSLSGSEMLKPVWPGEVLS